MAVPRGCTPASTGFDVSLLMPKLPPSMDMEIARNMPFTELKTIIDMSAQLGKEEKIEARYRAATEMRMVPRGEDDRMLKLHPARYYPQSLEDPDKIWEQMPLRVENHVTELCLSHLGLENKVSPLAIKKAGDRTNPLRLKYFLRCNLNVQQKAPRMNAFRAEKGDMGLTLEENWGDAVKVVQIQDALYAYDKIVHNLFPFDYGPLNLLTALHNWRWLAFRSDQIKALSSVIDSVMQRYAHQAAQRKPPMPMIDLDNFIKGHLKGMGGRSSLPDDFSDELDWGTESQAKGSSSQGEELCGQFNSSWGAGCQRAEDGEDFCRLWDGKTLAHKCSYKMGNGVVCLEFHSKKDHK